MLNDAFLNITEKRSEKLTPKVSYKNLHNTVMIQWLGKPDSMKINNQVHAVLAELSLSKIQAQKSAQHKCKNVMIEVELSQSIWNLEKFADKRVTRGFVKIFVHYAK